MEIATCDLLSPLPLQTQETCIPLLNPFHSPRPGPFLQTQCMSQPPRTSVAHKPDLKSVWAWARASTFPSPACITCEVRMKPPLPPCHASGLVGEVGVEGTDQQGRDGGKGPTRHTGAESEGWWGLGEAASSCYQE